MMRTECSVWMLGAMVVALASGAAAQPSANKMGETPKVLPSGFGAAVDRDIMSVREATARFKKPEDAEAAGYTRVGDCVEHQPAGAMGYHFQNNSLLDATQNLLQDPGFRKALGPE